MNLYDIAIIGLGTMGKALARNLASHKIATLVFDRHFEKTEQWIQQFGGPHLDGRKDFASLFKSLKRPRQVVILVPAGAAVTDVMTKLLPYLDRGDVIIDGGNSYYRSTIARDEGLQEKGIHFVGMGISGGEEGALKGPSLMVGCDKTAWNLIAPWAKKIAAKDFQGKPCVGWMGPNGAGHFVKMVHNGIEYAVLQMMAEIYHMLKDVYELPAGKIAETFKTLNKGKLKSYLNEIAVPVLNRKEGKFFLVDLILDRAGQKGTGRWVAIEALQQGVALPTIAAAVFERGLSSLKEERVELGKLVKKPKSKKGISLPACLKLLPDAFMVGLLSAHAQGFVLLQAASDEFKWDLDMAEIARVWEGGCILRSDWVGTIQKAWAAAKKKPMHLFKAKGTTALLQKTLPACRQWVAVATEAGISVPAFGTALSYAESMTSAQLPANFIQGLRDYFGAHEYQRIDKDGNFHTEWNQ